MNALVLARRVALFAIAPALLAGPLAAKANAQTYKALPFDKTLASKGALIRRYLRDPTGDAEAEKDLKAYFERYYFPVMTQHTDKALEKLGGLRTGLFKNYLSVAKGDSYQYIVRRAGGFGAGVMKDDTYHPAVRLNALLVLGLLDSRPAGSDGSPPVPNDGANRLLCGFLTKATADARRPRYELAGSLIGLERHTRFFDQLSDDAKRRTAGSIGKLLVTDELPGEYQRGVRPWVYSLAAKALGNTGTAGPKGAYFRAIAKRMGDTKLGTKNRARIASQLDRLDTEGVSIDATEAIAAIRELAAEIGRRESKLATQFEDLRLGGRGGRRVGQVAVQTRNKTAHRFRQTEDGYELVRQGLVELLSDLRAGVRAIGRVAAEDQRAELAEIDGAVNAAILAASNEDEGDLKVADAVKSMADRIDRVVNAEQADADEFAAR